MKKIVETYEEFIFSQLNESLNGDIYHFCNYAKIKYILDHNKLYLSKSLRDNYYDDNKNNNYGYKYYLSLSRSKSYLTGYPDIISKIEDNDGDFVNYMITFYADKLFSNYKTKPYKDKNVKDDEYEERLLSNNEVINNIKKYIKSIDIFFVEYFDYKYDLEDITLYNKYKNDIQINFRLPNGKLITKNEYINLCKDAERE